MDVLIVWEEHDKATLVAAGRLLLTLLAIFSWPRIGSVVCGGLEGRDADPLGKPTLQ
jgi:hypothetical protein